MEKSTSIGLIAGVALVLTAVFLNDGWQVFFDLPSALIVLGGTFSALLVTCSFQEIRSLPALFRELFIDKQASRESVRRSLCDLSRTCRRDGLIALEAQVLAQSDRTLRYGLELALDGSSEEQVDHLLRERILEEYRRMQAGPRFFASAGSYAPAFGMIGTLIGLIQMLHGLNDPSRVGAAMAVALVTTFYGAILANIVFLPVAARMRVRIARRMRVHEMMRTGVCAIIRGESPLALERQLQAFLMDDAPAGVRRMPLSRVA